jgi:hypothetical protein
VPVGHARPERPAAEAQCGTALVRLKSTATRHSPTTKVNRKRRHRCACQQRQRLTAIVDYHASTAPPRQWLLAQRPTGFAARSGGISILRATFATARRAGDAQRPVRTDAFPRRIGRFSKWSEHLVRVVAPIAKQSRSLRRSQWRLQLFHAQGKAFRDAISRNSGGRNRCGH